MDYAELYQRNVKGLRVTGGNAVGLCPFHEDARPSFSVNLETGLWQCFGCGEKGNADSFRVRVGETSAEVTRPSSSGASQHILATYDYRDEAGKLLYQVVRFFPKGFRQRRPTRGSGWTWNLQGVHRVLYRLPEMVAAPTDQPVLVCEGEKDADALCRLDLVATTCPGGAGKWRDDYSASLQGRQVVILPDNDEPGRKHAEQVAASLQGVAASVKVVSLPGLPAKGDVSDWLAAAGTKEDLLRLVGEAPEWAACPPRVAEIKDEVPEAIRRPLCLVKGQAYVATWLWVQTTDYQGKDENGRRARPDAPIIRHDQVLAIIRSDGALFCDAPVPSAQPLSELPVTVSLPEVPPASQLWSGAGVKRFLAGERPSPAEVFQQVMDVVDHFMDFSRSLTSQRAMAELLACYVLATYALDAFNVIGYLWPNGGAGTAKTKFLNTATSMAYLGQVILAGGSYASLRDLADYGATLAFDDAEQIMDTKKADPDKRTLLLAGNRRGATITVKEPAGRHAWVTRHINAFCPRLFSAIRLPDPVLASRTIVIPLVRSADPGKANADPCDLETWPCDRRRLIDDLWALGLESLPRLRHHYSQAVSRARLSGRNLEPWRAILAVALWLEEEHGVAGLFERLERLSVTYQSERSDLEASDPTRLAIMALRGMCDVCPRDVLEFKTAELAERINSLADELELADEGQKFTNPRRVGKLLKRLRFRKSDSRLKRGWAIGRAEVASLAATYGLPPHETNAANVTNAETSQSEAGAATFTTCAASATFGSERSTPTEDSMLPDPAQPVPLVADIAGAALAALGEDAAIAAYCANPPQLWTPEADVAWWASLRPAVEWEEFYV